MSFRNEHWSGPDNLIQRGSEATATAQDSEVAKIIKNMTVKEVLEVLKNHIQEKSHGDKRVEHWAGPDDLLSR